ncbi:MAG: hypothetical protein U5J98_09800 [Halobacteriales archaeon]|nr:hypothetical protein [Halobacteriales archaeon]
MATRSTSRRRYLQLGAGLGAVLTGCLGIGDDPPPTTGIEEGFEDGLSPWEQGADVPEDPNDPGHPVAWRISRSTAQSAAGGASLRLALDGSQDDGTIWAYRRLPVTPGHAYEISMRAEAWSPSESFNTIAHLVMYAGTEPPTAEESFPSPGTNSSGAGVQPAGGLREPLNQVEGWRPYSFTWRTPRLDTDAVIVAVGISAVWETGMTYFVDEVRATAVPT